MGKTVILCETEEIANEVLLIADSLGYKWCDGKKFQTNNNWNFHKNESCYNIIEGRFCAKWYYESIGFNIMHSEEFINLYKNKMKKDISLSHLKAGMWVEYRNGSKGLILTRCNTEYFGKDIPVVIMNGSFMPLIRCNDDLTDKNKKEWDIVALYAHPGLNVDGDNLTGNLPLYWKREDDILELTLKDIAMIVGCDVKRIKIIEK